VSRFVASFGYVGLIPVAPGTAGAVVAVPFAWLLHWTGGPVLLIAVGALVFALGWWATRAETTGGGDPDPSWIVVDEVVGQWVALLPLSVGLWAAGAPPHVFPWPGWVGAFLLFRLFDIWKPWPVSWADRQPPPVGVMTDDVIAGAMAAAVLSLSAAVAHGALL